MRINTLSVSPFSPAPTNVAELVSRLAVAEHELVSALGHTAEAVIDSEGHAHLLRQAQVALRSSENRFRTLIESSTDLIVLLEPDGRFRYVSPAISRILGYAQSELAGGDGLHLFHPEDAQRLRDTLRQISGTPRSSAVVILRCQHKDGSYRWLESTATNQLAEPGLKALVVNCRDITERIEAENALQTSEVRFRTMLQGVEAGVIVHGPDLRITAHNTKATELLGVTAAQLTDWRERDPLWSWVQIDGSAYRPEDLPAHRALVTGQPVRNRIIGYVRPSDGDFVWVIANANPVLTPAGEVAEVIVSFMDATAQIKAEQAVRENAAFTEDVLNSLIAHVAVLDEHCNIISVNEAWRRFALGNGAAEGDFVGQNYLAVCRQSAIRGDSGAAEAAAGICAVLQGELNHFKMEYSCHAPSKPAWYLLRVSPLSSGRRGVVVSHHDISESRLSLDAMRASEKRFRTLFEQAAVGVTLIDAGSGRFLQVNERLGRILGYNREKLLGLTFADITHPTEHGSSREVLEKLRAGLIREASWEKKCRRQDGSEAWLNLTLSAMWAVGESPDCCIGVVLDISERKQLEEQFRQSQKMEAIGQLSGGIAHDFNNMLAVINGHLGLLELTGRITPEIAHSMKVISAATERAANLTRQLLLFSRQQRMQRRNFDLAVAVTEMTKMLHRMVGETVAFKLKQIAAPLFIHADPGMIDQVLLNLAVNARDAMPAGGTLLVVTERADFTEETLPRTKTGLTPGSYAKLSVTDTGTGIPPEVLPRIFEPFFTTKEVGKGTGLGLATVYGIVQQHGGWIDVRTESGWGTTFEVYLPEVAQESSTDASGTDRAAKVHHAHGETILLVEDEAAVRSVIESILQESGYRVLSAENASQARQLWLDYQAEIELLLTDVVMPGGCNGKELAQQLVGQKPNLRVVYMSGYNEAFAQSDQLQEGKNFLSKPFATTDLLAVVQASLSSRETIP